MAIALLSSVVADLTVGKPALVSLPTTASVRDALRALKLLVGNVSEISVWECVCVGVPGVNVKAQRSNGDVGEQKSPYLHEKCRCVGKVCMQRIVCHLATQHSVCNPVEALREPVTALLPDNFLDMTVEHVDPQASLLEILQLIEAGVQNLVVPIMNHGRRCYSQKGVTNEFSNHLQKSHGGQFFCWLTHEDVLRFLLGSISVFSPVPMTSIEELGIIRTDVCLVKVDEDAVSALESIKVACMEMSAVAVVEDAEVPGAFNLVGDISCTTLQACNEMVALALATLSAGDFLLYVEECWHPTEVVTELIRKKLHEKLGWKNIEHDGDVDVNLDKVKLMLQNFEIWEESSSDGEDSGLESPTGPHDLSRKWPYMHRHSSNKFGMSHKHRSGPIFCNPKSSLVAVLLQALAYREHYVWVLRDDGTLLGIVTFSDILTLMFNCVNI